MKIEPMQTERIRITAAKPNPDYDTGVRLPLLDISEYETQWGIDFGFTDLYCELMENSLSTKRNTSEP